MVLDNWFLLSADGRDNDGFHKLRLSSTAILADEAKLQKPIKIILFSCRLNIGIQSDPSSSYLSKLLKINFPINDKKNIFPFTYCPGFTDELIKI
jgi:hypothetical protein